MMHLAVAAVGLVASVEEALRADDSRGISLPSGSSLDIGALAAAAVPPTERDISRMQAAGAFLIEYPSGKPFALLQNNSGKLHGACFAWHENGAPMLVGNYQQGERAGAFRIAADDGTPLMDAQYLRGNKDGLSCYYSGGSLALVQEHTKGRLSWSHRLESQEVVESIEHVAFQPARPSADMDELLQSLAAFEKRLKVNEYDIKKLVKELEDDIRKQRAAIRGALSQRMIQQRINARAAEKAALISGLRAVCGP